MGDKHRSAASQWGISAPPSAFAKPNGSESEKADTAEKDPDPGKNPDERPVEISLSDAMKRRGFFEAISTIECPLRRLSELLGGYREEAAKRLKEIDEQAKTRISFLEELITLSSAKIEELKEKLKAIEEYKESSDPDLQNLVAEKKKEEEELLVLQNKLTDVRIKLGEAKSRLIEKSLDEAHTQAQKALNIQSTIYEETRKLNLKKFDDEKDHLVKLSKYYSELYLQYEARHKKINKHLVLLDVDGISPITTQKLTTIGSISFAVAGFFFSTFAGATGFGNQDMLYYILSGLVDTAKQPVHGLWKIAILLALIALVTAVSVVCNFLITLLKNAKAKKEEKLINEIMLGGETSKKISQLEYHASIKSNNWYAFWLQLIPGILIAGLIILGISNKVGDESINAINASSEGLIIGTFIAMSLAGLIYLYIIKIVEPRLVKKHDADPEVHVNWIKANWELVTILITFLVFCICIIAIPYTSNGEFGIIPVDQRTRYAILLFIGICLVGSISFAYGIRSNGLIQTNQYLERVLQRLNHIIAYCSAPQTTELHNAVDEEHGNLLRHVLAQLSFKTALINKVDTHVHKRRSGEQKFFQKLLDFFKPGSQEDEQQPKETIQNLTFMEPWEARYFPHIVDELKAVEFEYLEKKTRVQKTEEEIIDYNAAKATERRQCENEIAACRNDIKEYRDSIETALKEKTERYTGVEARYALIETDLQDGFHLGMWYRENHIGPTHLYFRSCSPWQPDGQPLLLPHK